MTQPSCEEVRDAAAELALGVVAGQERARLLQHLDGCPVCRREVAELMPTADALLLAAPTVEPPAGFEDRTIRRVLGPRRRRRGRSWMAAAALVVIASVAAVAGTQLVDRRQDRQAASFVEANNVQTPRAARVTAGDGRDVGQALAYDGGQPFVFVSIADSVPDTSLVAEAVGRDGARRPVGVLTMRGGRGSLSAAVEGETADVVELVLTEAGTVRYRARFA